MLPEFGMRNPVNKPTNVDLPAPEGPFNMYKPGDSILRLNPSITFMVPFGYLNFKFLTNTPVELA